MVLPVRYPSNAVPMGAKTGILFFFKLASRGAHNSTYIVCLVRRPSGLSWNDENWAWRLPKDFFSHRSQQQPLETAMAARGNHQQINIVLGYQMQETAGDITFA
jgi:hypothetical protein